MNSRDLGLLSLALQYTVFTSTVITCLDQLFALHGMPSYVHSDWGFFFVSRELNVLDEARCLHQSIHA